MRYFIQYSTGNYGFAYRYYSHVLHLAEQSLNNWKSNPDEYLCPVAIFKIKLK